MGEDKKWYRVNDPLSPVYGCDVRGWRAEAVFGPDDALVVIAMRRVDIFVGDRPFQLVAPDGENLGLAVRTDQLVESPIQDEIMETGTDRPYGLCIDESEMRRADGCTIRMARFERAIQVALEDAEGNLLATNTNVHNGDEGFLFWEEEILKMFSRGDDQDDIAYALRNN